MKMRSFSPRHRDINRKLATREVIAETIKDRLVRGEDISEHLAQLDGLEAPKRDDPSEIDCFRCGAALDEDSDEYGVLTVAAFATTLNAEPVRYKGEFAVLLVLCASCREHFLTVVSEQEV
jgi:hypothetical protein